MPRPNPAPLFRWMKERQKIYRLKSSGHPFPWTNDPILRKYGFTNVFRELDKTTVWIRENWREPYKDHPMLPFAMALARRLNWPPSLAELGFPRHWNAAHFATTLDARKERGEKYVTGAHQVFPGPGGQTSFAWHQAMSLTDLHEQHNQWIKPTLEETGEALSHVHGFGPFMAYELITELTATKWLKGAPDLNTWCTVKAGSRIGLNAVMGRDLKTRQRVEVEVAEAVELLRIARPALADADPMFKKLTLRNIEDSLCEYGKYYQTKTSGYEPRSQYWPDAPRPWKD